jgi:AraC-like DNA-binding protein
MAITQFESRKKANPKKPNSSAAAAEWVKILANSQKFSRYHFSKMYQKQMGISPIAEDLGFEDPFYFSRTFKKIMGHSPKAYRALNKG